MKKIERTVINDSGLRFSDFWIPEFRRLRTLRHTENPTLNPREAVIIV